MKDIKELLIELKNYIKKQHCFCGMCLSASEMCMDDLISIPERVRIMQFLKTNSHSINKTDSYWWTRGAKQPRINWIDEQLKSRL